VIKQNFGGTFKGLPEVPQDFNQAERSLRLAVTKRKISGGSRSMERFAQTADLRACSANLSATGTVGHRVFQASLDGEIRKWHIPAISFAPTADLNPYIEPENQLVNYGLIYQKFISNVPSPIQIFGKRNITVIPHERHRAVGKETGLTNHIERLNNTFRQRVSRLVRESLSFSKKLNNSLWGDLVLHSWL